MTTIVEFTKEKLDELETAVKMHFDDKVRMAGAAIKHLREQLAMFVLPEGDIIVEAPQTTATATAEVTAEVTDGSAEPTVAQ